MPATFLDVLRLKSKAMAVAAAGDNGFPPIGMGDVPPVWVSEFWRYIERLCPQLEWRFIYNRDRGVSRIFWGHGNLWRAGASELDWTVWKMGTLAAAQVVVDKALTGLGEELQGASINPPRKALAGESREMAESKRWLE